MTAGRRRREPRLDQRDDLLAGALRRQRIDERIALDLTEVAQLLDKSPEIQRLHDTPAAAQSVVSKVSQH